MGLVSSYDLPCPRSIVVFVKVETARAIQRATWRHPMFLAKLGHSLVAHGFGNNVELGWRNELGDVSPKQNISKQGNMAQFIMVTRRSPVLYF